MSITFTASSLEEIAKYFDRMQNNAANKCLNANTKVAKASAQAEKMTWKNAATFLRQTTLAPDVLAVPPGAIGATPSERLIRAKKFAGYDMSPHDCQTLHHGTKSGLVFASLEHQGNSETFMYKLTAMTTAAQGSSVLVYSRDEWQRLAIGFKR